MGQDDGAIIDKTKDVGNASLSVVTLVASCAAEFGMRVVCQTVGR